MEKDNKKEKRMTVREWEDYFRNRKGIPEELPINEKTYTEDQYIGYLQRKRILDLTKKGYKTINKIISDYNRGRRDYKKKKENEKQVRV